MEESKLEETVSYCRERYPKHFVRNKVEKLVEKAEYLLENYEEADKNCVIAAAWLQFLHHPDTGYNGERYHVASARAATNYLRGIGVDNKDANTVGDAVRSHRPMGLPYPESIESRILFSANYLAGTEVKKVFGRVVKDIDEDATKKKFLLPEAATGYEKDKIDRLRQKYDVD